MTKKKKKGQKKEEGHFWGCQPVALRGRLLIPNSVHDHRPPMAPAFLANLQSVVCKTSSAWPSPRLIFTPFEYSKVRGVRRLARPFLWPGSGLRRLHPCQRVTVRERDVFSAPSGCGEKFLAIPLGLVPGDTSGLLHGVGRS